jgi:hypothetical protein
VIKDIQGYKQAEDAPLAKTILAKPAGFSEILSSSTFLADSGSCLPVPTLWMSARATAGDK